MGLCRKFSAIFGLTLLLLLCSMSQAQEGMQDERLLKAAYIFNFAKFTLWPQSVWAGEAADAPIGFCTIGSDELVGELQKLNGRNLNLHVITVKAITRGGEAAGCHMLYVATSQGTKYQHVLKELQGKPVLTVSQIPGFGQGGGMIELFRQEEKIRFLINLEPARDAGLGFSSRLLGLAKLIGMVEPQ